MVRRELIFFGTLIVMCLIVFVFPNFLKGFPEYTLPAIGICVLLGFITPRYFSKKYNKWLETNPFKNEK